MRKVLCITSFFITALVVSAPALAQEAASGAAAPDPVKGMLVSLPIWAAMAALLYFGIFYPQKTQQKKQTEFLSSLNRGDEVVTSSGIIGKISGLTDRVVTLEISPNTEIKVLRAQVQGYLKDMITT